MQYSVRSAYDFCVKEVILGNYFQVEGRQDLIWRAKILPILNSLNWRICRNCLPTRTSLHDKGVNCPQDYVICDTGVEHMYSFVICWSRVGLWKLQGRFLGCAKSSTAMVLKKNYCSISPPPSKKKNKHVSCINF